MCEGPRGRRGASRFRIFRSPSHPIAPSRAPIEFDATLTRLLCPVIAELFEFGFGFRFAKKFFSDDQILRRRCPPDRETRTARRLSLSFFLFFFLSFYRERHIFGVRWMSGGFGWMSGGCTCSTTVFPIPFTAFFGRFVHPTVRWMSGGQACRHDLFGGLDSDQNRLLVDSFFEQLSHHVGDRSHTISALSFSISAANSGSAATRDAILRTAWRTVV